MTGRHPFTGQSAALVDAVAPTGVVMARILAEAEDVIGRTAGLVS